MTQLSIAVQPAGIYFGVLPNIAGDWLAAQKNLTVMMKDGYTFFQHNRNIFAERFSNSDKTTTILINNPDTPFIDAIAEKDLHKTSETQRSDFMQTILLLQDIFAAVAQTGIQPNAKLLGYDAVGTDNIFLGDHEVIQKFYRTPSYRGPLMGVAADAWQSNEAGVIFMAAAETCIALADGQIVTVKNEIKQRPPARDLLSYNVPQIYSEKDLRS